MPKIPHLRLLLPILVLVAGLGGLATARGPAKAAPDPAPPAQQQPGGGTNGRAQHLADRLLDTVGRVEGNEDGRRTTLRGRVLLGTILVFATFLTEDLTCIAAGLLVSHGHLGFLAASIACFVGIFVGDLLLVIAGRWLGERILDRAPLKWLVKPETLEGNEHWFARQGLRVVFLSRFIPGSRLPLFLAAGVLRVPLRKVATALLIAGLVWTPALVGLSAWTGTAILRWLENYERVALWAVAGAALLTYLVAHFVLPLFTWRGRRLLWGRYQRARHWEFWPLWLFQVPVVLHVLRLGIGHRRPALFTAANPGIPGGGFVEESKAGILAGFGASERLARFRKLRLSGPLPGRIATVELAMRELGLAYPVVLKPDVGERGRGVAVVRSRSALEHYLLHAPADTMLQEHVAGEEFGVFYVRRPGAAAGEIFSITGKEFPCVVGDGVRSLDELILADPRAVCMAERYFEANAARLDEVPAAGTPVQLVEIGNHCRGTIFRDCRRLATPALAASLDALAGHFPGFHFGRFDLRVPSAAALAEGRDFKILEVNGVTSEATHVYEPGYPLGRAYRDLFEQWRLAFEIGAANAAAGAHALTVGALFALLAARRRRFASIPTAPRNEERAT